MQKCSGEPEHVTAKTPGCPISFQCKREALQTALKTHGVLISQAIRKQCPSVSACFEWELENQNRWQSLSFCKKKRYTVRERIRGDQMERFQLWMG